jgi:electron transport complex protein RnfB
VCPAGCFGLADCVEACPFDALAMGPDRLPVVDLDKCTGCVTCVVACPRGGSDLLSMVRDDAPIVVRCSSHDKAKAKRSYCTVSCIACKKCEKECPEEAIKVEDFLAVVDYHRCTGCLTCVEVCPQDCIEAYGRGTS